VTVGIIGVGAMGLAVTERLVAAGFAVCGHRRGALVTFSAAGGQAMASAAGVAAASDPLILLLPSDEALGAVMVDIAPALRPGQVVLCLGTHRIPSKLAAAKITAGQGAILLDGEISGTPGMVRAMQASVLLAGDAQAASRVAPVLAGFARATTDCGAFGNAARMKLVTNYLVGVHTLAAADALAMGMRLGLDPRAMVAALAPSAGGSTMLAVRGRMMADSSYADGDMTSFVRFFDRLREALAEAGAAPGSALLDATEAQYRGAIASGHDGRDIAAIHDWLREGRGRE